MSRRKLALVCAVALLAVVPGVVFAQTEPDLTPLYNEFAVLFDEIGADSISHIQQFGLTMDGTGRAQIGPHVFFSWSAGTVFLPGILTFRAGDNPFTIFDINQIVSGMLESEPALADLYAGSAEFFLNPGMRLTLGAGLKNGLEFYAHFGIIPQALITATEGLLQNFVDIQGLVFNRFNAGVRIRKVLLSDQGAFPAVSLGAGYTLTRFNMGLNDLSALPLEGFEMSGFSLGLDGALNIGTSMHTAGVELAVSKTLLFFAPFVKITGYYQWTRYTGGIENLQVTMTNSALPDLDPIVATGTDPVSEQRISDLSFVGSAGFELVFGKLSFIAQGAYDVGSATPAANVSIQFRF